MPLRASQSPSEPGEWPGRCSTSKRRSPRLSVLGNTRYQYNPDNTLTTITNRSNGTLVSQHAYTYNGTGNRDTLTDTLGTTTNTYRFTYDSNERLKGIWNATTNTQLEGYVYDALGNRLSRTLGATTDYYTYDAANQLKDIRQGSPTGTLIAGLVYDSHGNLTKKCQGGTVTRTDTTCTGTTLTTLSYDALNQLTQAQKTAAPTETYVYDDQGRRIQKTRGTAQTNYLYNGPDIHADHGPSWTVPNAQYTHGPNMDNPILRTTASTTQYYHQDGLGSIVAVTNNTGTPTGTARYDAWGNTRSSTGTIPQYGYTGREPDDTGLIYYRARYYDPSIGRFTQRDPIGLQGGINPYAYVNNNPTNYTDPTGLLPADVPRMSMAAAAYYGGNPVMTSTGQSLAAYRSGSNDTLDTAWNVATSLLPGAGIGEAFNQASVGNIGLAMVALATEIPLFKGARIESRIWGGVERGGCKRSKRPKPLWWDFLLDYEFGGWRGCNLCREGFAE